MAIRRFVTAAAAIALLIPSLALAAGGRVTYPDGSAVVGAQVRVHLQEVEKLTLTTDAGGRFTLANMDFTDAFVQIKAPDGKDYASVNLPVKLFENGEVAVVLQPAK